MIVTDHREHAAVARGAGQVGVAHGIHAAVKSGPLTVPEPVNTIMPCVIKKVGLLSPPVGGHRDVLVDGGKKMDLVLRQKPVSAPQLLIEVVHGRAPVTGDKAGGIQACGAITDALQHGHLDQGLGTGQIELTIRLLVLIVERECGEGHRKQPLQG